MPYRPRVENRAGEIFAGGIKKGAAYQAAGIEEGAASMAAGIKKAGSALGAGIEKAGDIWLRQAEQKKAEADLWSALNTKIDTYGKMGFLTGRDADALAGIKKPNDLAAALTVIDQDIGRRQQQQHAISQQNAMFERQYAMEKMRHDQDVADALAKQEAEARGVQPGDVKVITDPINGQKTTFVFQNKAQIIPLDEKKNTDTPVTGVKKVEIGQGQFIYTDQAGNIIDPKKIVGEAGGGSEDLQDLKKEQARLAGQVAEGNKKPGPDWWPWSTSNADKLKGVTAQINTLEGGAQPSAAAGTPPYPIQGTSQVRPPAAGAPAAAVTQYKTKEDVRNAYRSGQLSREDALKILQTQFE